MKQHHYRITVEHLADKDGQAPATPASLQFEAGNHDEILNVIERVHSRGDFDADTSAAFALGLKLFGEVMLTHRDHPLFATLAPHFGDFMKQLKARPVAAN
jgi:hypothetical protein